MNQRANAVADLAAVLFQEQRGPSELTKMRKLRSRNFWDRYKRKKVAKGKPLPKKDPLEPAGMGRLEGVSIRWADKVDTEYAKEWPEEVEHHSLERSRYTAAFPAYEIADPETPELLEEDAPTPEQAAA